MSIQPRRRGREIADREAARQVDYLERTAAISASNSSALLDPRQGIEHVVVPELG